MFSVRQIRANPYKGWPAWLMRLNPFKKLNARTHMVAAVNGAQPSRPVVMIQDRPTYTKGIGLRGMLSLRSTAVERDEKVISSSETS